ncbi:MAG TPA: VgrG-related protein [Ktedonobacteraceae bacterium]|nr:VgrG-related protein [Ktedonobacteraceae bacterium]
MPESQNLYTHISLKIDGADVSHEFMQDLVEVTVENSLHLPDVATIRLQDTRLHWIDDTSLIPGKTLQIWAKVEHDEKQLFDGEIVEIEPDFAASTQIFTVRAFDRLHRLARGRHVRSFVNVSDEDLIKKLAQEVDLQTQVASANHVYPYIFQNNETNLEFLQGRAANLGYLLYVQGKTLHCEPLRTEGTPVEVQWGAGLYEFRPRLSTIGQLNSVTARGWDPANRQEIVGQAHTSQEGPQIGVHQRGSDLAQSAFHVHAESLVASIPIRVQAIADRLAQAVADRAAGQFIEADGVCSGTPALIAGASVKIKSVGDRFSGTYFVTSALHLYNAKQGYHTQFTISGYHPSTLFSLLTRAEEERLSTPPGLVVGVVTDNQDPQKQGRVKVKYPWLSSEHASDWARVISPGGGNKRGLQFLPEVNDEVLVGFEMGDIHYPYVLGGLWNGRDAPPEPQAVSGGKVQKRVILSRTGHKIILDDSDGGGGITIEDKNGNQLLLDSGSNALKITIKGDTTLKAQGNLNLEAQGNLNLKAQGQLQINGLGVGIDGGASNVTVRGNPINLN